ncbi:hypothetical protein ABEG18_06120 [Alsobacter sp. KACC 23698]|uniref:Uncharacterized protein n=1 Tax=Alsobacter sp. KACC 23698 TaxID=3149229 RepID=A0AAU7JJV2_9HYPH
MDIRFMIWLDRPTIVVSGQAYVMAGLRLPWTRASVHDMDSVELLSETEFRQRFAGWAIPPIPDAVLERRSHAA